MRKIHTILAACLFCVAANAQIAVDTAYVPQFIEGSTPTNNNRVPFWFWAEVSGLTPNATYRYYTAVDTLNASATSNGVGNPYFVNMLHASFRRSANPSMSNPLGHDSLVADANGKAKGWFGLESSGNGRFTPGNTVYPKIMFNNGAGGTGIATRLLFSAYPVTVLSFGTTASSMTQGSALYDSLGATPENFIFVYDSIIPSGRRPVSIAVVENDSMDLYALPTTAAFYRTNVDTLPMRWGTIIPNDLPNGIRSLAEHNFATDTLVDVTTDDDGWWCSGVNTVNMSNGVSAQYLNSTFSLSSSAYIPDTTYTGFSATFTASSNSGIASYNWNFGDLNSGTGSVTTHTYNVPGTYTASVVVSTGGCSDTITGTVVVILFTGISSSSQFNFTVAPDPSDGNFVVATGNDRPKTICVMNALGQTVFVERAAEKTVQLNLTSVAKGIYFVKVQDEVTGKSSFKKILVR